MPKIQALQQHKFVQPYLWLTKVQRILSESSVALKVPGLFANKEPNFLNNSTPKWLCGNNHVPSGTHTASSAPKYVALQSFP
jgi:hypothetical protein